MQYETGPWEFKFNNKSRITDSIFFQKLDVIL